MTHLTAAASTAAFGSAVQVGGPHRQASRPPNPSPNLMSDGVLLFCRKTCAVTEQRGNVIRMRLRGLLLRIEICQCSGDPTGDKKSLRCKLPR